jgi:hypothetical protein
VRRVGIIGFGAMLGQGRSATLKGDMGSCDACRIGYRHSIGGCRNAGYKGTDFLVHQGAVKKDGVGECKTSGGGLKATVVLGGKF